jgi:hypothetical protein
VAGRPTYLLYVALERKEPGSLNAAEAAFAAIHALALRSPLRTLPFGGDDLVGNGLASRDEDGFRLTDQGHRSHRTLCERERQTIDLAGLGMIFAPIPTLARRLRGLGLRWGQWSGELERGQMIRELYVVADETAAILSRTTAFVPRFCVYLARLQAARVRVGSGELDYAFAADVDSIAGVWHELHEDYLQILGIAYNDREATA